MSQNRSTAVMQRRVEAPDSLDFFPTPAWGTRALVEHVLIANGIHDWHGLRDYTVWEPACGEGHMVEPLREYFHDVHASDCHAHGFGEVRDFLFPGPPPAGERIDWVITNPPFRLADDFVRRGLDVARRGVAMLVRSAFAEGGERYQDLFSVMPPAIDAQFVERLPMVKGRLDREASSATAYSWMVWLQQGHQRPGMPWRRWIPPCRRDLERDSDYPAPETAEAGPLFA